MQFHAANQWRVVTGNVERLECRSTGVSIGTSSARIPIQFANVSAISSTSNTLRLGDVDENDEYEFVDILAMAGTGRLYLEDSTLYVHGTGTSSAKFRFNGSGQLDCDGDVVAFSSAVDFHVTISNAACSFSFCNPSICSCSSSTLACESASS